MATTKFKFRTSSVSGKQGTLFLQKIHKRVARQVNTSYKRYPKEWDANRWSVVIPKDTSSNRSSYLHAVQEALQRDASRLQLIILSLDHSRKEYHAKDVVKRFLKKEQSMTFRFLWKACRSKEGRKGIGPLPSSTDPHSTVSTGSSRVVCSPSMPLG